MDPYWLFFKAVVNAVISLMSAAVMLFATAPARRHNQHPLQQRAAIVRAALTTASAVGTGDIVGRVQPAALGNRLHANNPVERATAACEVKKLGDEARALMSDLLQLLSDDAEVPGDVCGDWGRRRSDVGEFHTTPGEKAAAALVAIGTTAYEPLIQALTAPQWVGRKNAAWALGALDDQRAVKPLSAALRDREAPVRRNAAWALGAIDDEQAVPALIAALRDADPGTRARAAWALGALDSPEAVPGLIETLGDSDEDVRANAAWALGAIDDSRAVSALSRALREDTHSKVRAQSAWALGAIGDNRASTALSAALKDTDPKVRRQAAWALGAIEH